MRYRQLAVGVFISIASSYIGSIFSSSIEAHDSPSQLPQTYTASPLKTNSVKSKGLPSDRLTQAIPIEPSNSPRPIIPAPTNSNSAEVTGLSFSSTGQLLIDANQPIAYQTNFDRISGLYKVTISNTKIAVNFQRPTLAINSPIERIRLVQVGSSLEIGIKTIAGWQIRESQRLSNKQIKLQVSLNSVLPPPKPTSQTSPPPLPQNNSIPSPPNNGDRRRGVVLVDAGHGGRDPGAVANGVQEKDIVLPMSLTLGQTLQSMGYTVYYTRTNDVEIDLEPRVGLAERVKADIFVSIHANSLASLNSAVNGVETYYARGSTSGRELASYVHSQVINNTGASDRSVRAAGFYVIAKTSMPAILVETGFVTNPREAANLSNPNYQKQMAEAIARGIDQFLSLRKP
ncbi:N-acetylmuramoyl-L-alanine amidase [Pseudanabaena sp. FACHB-1998]|uniref:N-acetylmuramoyl-L-alanine amidase family protein n=1 Tax=Pseudanabaena sp. FACHB-1998 TaxID=2692858 RepID=UPI00167FE3E2|nr:N-acetylmuramoyl-L-alanine amidase [Pseudanabaena sp. FACHB-1998]MBD2176044.1 N-acetylmuramoyl-L-alanine amidase [Pseudanabaena sp. FACHB-1998]